jgi:putative spermidine/putrescine transport system permease protein/spermidine/putrescine transport system permease protein
MARSERRYKSLLVWTILVSTLAFLYVPLISPAIRSFGRIPEGGGIFSNYRAIFDDQLLVQGIYNTLIIGGFVAAITPAVALAIAQALRSWRRPRLILGLVLLPLFIPGVSMGVATALFFQVLGLSASLATMIIVQVLWALPFATLVILTVMASFDEVFLEAGQMLGANRWQAFWEIEFPQIWPGVLGGAIFSLILSFNETIRTSIVQGGQNTVQTYLWSQYQQVGFSPRLYALMTGLIVLTLLLVAILALAERRLSKDD